MSIGTEGNPREQEGHLGPRGVGTPRVVSGVDGLHTVSELMVDDGLVLAPVLLRLVAQLAQVSPVVEHLIDEGLLVDGFALPDPAVRSTPWS
jgi:hypothetical protein